MRKGELGIRNDIHTIYLGGGTPSQITIPQLRQLFDTIYKYNKVATDAEITIECNPDDVTDAFVEGLQTLPVNRISMGAQTFDDTRLKFLHRRHTASQVVEAIDRFRKNGYTNISIDLMYGFPDETLDDWNHDITQALSLKVEHLSAYCLTIEEGTPLQQMLLDGKIMENDEELERQMYETLIDRLETAGYEHYEISNFARQGYRSHHNSSYWNGTPYIGIGAAAHSYDIRTRSWNVSDLHQYIDNIQRGKRPYEEELLDDDTRYNDTITVALRTREGLDLTTLSERHRSYCLQNARRFLNDGLLTLDSVSRFLHLTRRGLFVSDMIMTELIGQ
jgi:oxygen-independent coproporphyrinogen-3 oxidase